MALLTTVREESMKRTILLSLVIGIMAVIAASCSRQSGHCDRFDEYPCPGRMKEYHECPYLHGHGFENRDGDRQDHWYWYEHAIAPREFYDAVDFGRGHDSLYGDLHVRRDGDRHHRRGCGFRHRGLHHEWFTCPHYRHRNDLDHEDVHSERHAPFMAPGMEYEE
jgi:hypothetical protein